MIRLRTLLLLLLAPLAGLSAQVVQPASAFLDVEPLGARVRVDGKLLPDTAPLLLRGLSAGRHNISVWKEGYQAAQTSFEVTDDRVPEVKFSLSPLSLVASFPENKSVTFAQNEGQETSGHQFRFPLGTYEVSDAEGHLRVAPAFPDEGILTVAGWSLLVVSSAAVLSTISDIYHSQTGWSDHPSTPTIALWSTTLFELPWFLSAQARKDRFLKASSPEVSSNPEKLNSASRLFALGEAALEQGDLAGAESSFRQLAHDFPESRLVPGAWFRLARIHTVTGRRELALGEYRLVAETWPQAAYYDRARQALADLYEAQGDPTRALESLDQMLLVDGFFDRADVEVQKERLVAAQGASGAP